MKVIESDFEFKKIDTLIQLAIQEDIGTGDITTENLVPENLVIEGSFVAKDEGIVAGLPVVEYFFSKLDKKAIVKRIVEEGAQVNKGNIIAVVKGSARALLSGERIALNFLQRLSGIATLTSQFVERAKPVKVDIMDTRKTIPGWRYLEKYAVAIGGGVNHRMGLYDQSLIKDNHLDIMKSKLFSSSSFAGGVEDAVSLLRRKLRRDILIEIEVRTIDEVRNALKAGVDIVLFDNMNIAQLKDAVKLVKEWKSKKKTNLPLTEASGNVTLENVRLVAETGVDRISVGAITHSAKAMDISLEIEYNT
ncbi:MAG: nicotinate-nucleotide diphosphorylase (carboxylating) [Planctomycetes bacterium RIFCSPHIGHO2_02_FULL_38_41]|nr:MAG: nicotinate-nucleotide diphosphorylase (carboxylating) [Planctomycetes bacterium RIFCSPHIGHO2_02_FULL_38_41]